MNVVLFQPEIPANTGNIIRLCANTGSTLSLIRPFGFVLDDRKLLRAGLDYHEFVAVRTYDSLEECLAAMPEQGRVFAATSKGTALPSEACFAMDDVLVFGRETSGLPDDFVVSLPAEQRIRIPMVPDSRCYNLANAAAILIYEVWRQCGFAGAAGI